MGYRTKISAMIVMLAWASTSFAIVGGYKIIKKKAVREAVEKVSNQAKAAKHAEVIRRGEALQQQARQGEKLSAAELQVIYEGRVAALKVEKAEKLTAIHKQYPDKHSPEDIAAAAQRRDEDIATSSIWYHGKIKQEFEEKYPRQVAIEKLEAEHQRDLVRWHDVYDVSKDLTDGIPVMRYTPEFTDKMSAIIKDTPIATDLSDLVKGGNLQEVMWRLDEDGFATEATAMKKLIEDMLTNAKIVDQDDQSLTGAAKPLLLKFDSGLRGVFKGDYGQEIPRDRPEALPNPEREIAAYRFDQLIGLNVFPITVPRRMDGYQGNGSVQLFIDGAKGNFHRQYFNYAKLIGKDPLDLELIRRGTVTNKYLARNNTFFTLTLDGDGYDALGNNLAPIKNNLVPVSGRSIKVDAHLAFGDKHRSVGEIKKNIKRWPLYLDADFIARLDSITIEQLEAIFQPLFEPETSESIVSNLHANIRNYVKAARELAE